MADLMKNYLKMFGNKVDPLFDPSKPFKPIRTSTKMKPTPDALARMNAFAFNSRSATNPYRMPAMGGVRIGLSEAMGSPKPTSPASDSSFFTPSKDAASFMKKDEEAAAKFEAAGVRKEEPMYAPSAITGGTSVKGGSAKFNEGEVGNAIGLDEVDDDGIKAQNEYLEFLKNRKAKGDTR